ncbi:MAG: alpha/beta fold hydrolase [Spirochaetes bacterium]|jgi:pimeloyl-ACP methyl ester carboxylesterase|nr:alpha/beta fold hydrolase [Spirochaetota bacterium]
MLMSCASTGGGTEAPSLYTGPEAREVAHLSYNRAMDLWSCEYRDDWVETAYGRTHVVTAGPVGAPPLILVPGLFADATMWYPNAGALAEHYRVHAVDLPVFGGKSEPTAGPSGGNAISCEADYAAWFSELLGHYGYEQVALAGLSYGSWVSLAIARQTPQLVSAAVLLDPSEVFMPMNGGIAWRGFWSFMVFPNRSKYARFFTWLGGGYSDPDMDVWFEHMLDVIEYGSVGMTQVPRHRIYSPEELEMVRMPVLVLAGGKPILYKDPAEFSSAARTALPHATVEIVPDAGHGLNMEKAAYVNERMLRFLQESWRQ